MIKKITHNWVWKAISLLIAFLLWLAVVNYDDPYITRKIDRVVVEKRNEIAITSQDQAIEYKAGEYINITVRGKRSIIDRLAASDIIAYADMEKVSITGAIDIEVEVDEQIEILEKTPNNMQIALEHIDTTLRDIQVFYEGELEENHIRLDPIVTPNQIEITGPESKLAIISSVIVPIKIDNASNDVTVYVTPQILDSESNEILGLEVSNNQIQVQVPIQTVKVIPVVFNTVGSIDDKYRLISMELDTNYITIRGEDEAINNIKRLVVSGIDLSEFTDQTLDRNINLTTYLPEGISLHNSESTILLKTIIKPIVSEAYTITPSDITVKYLTEGLQFKFLEEEDFVVEIKGIEEDLIELTVEDVQPSISLKELGEGEHGVELVLEMSDQLEVITEAILVRVELTKVEAVVEEVIEE